MKSLAKTCVRIILAACVAAGVAGRAEGGKRPGLPVPLNPSEPVLYATHEGNLYSIDLATAETKLVDGVYPGVTSLTYSRTHKTFFAVSSVGGPPAFEAQPTLYRVGNFGGNVTFWAVGALTSTGPIAFDDLTGALYQSDTKWDHGVYHISLLQVDPSNGATTNLGPLYDGDPDLDGNAPPSGPLAVDTRGVLYVLSGGNYSGGKWSTRLFQVDPSMPPVLSIANIAVGSAFPNVIAFHPQTNAIYTVDTGVDPSQSGTALYSANNLPYPANIPRFIGNLPWYPHQAFAFGAKIVP